MKNNAKRGRGTESFTLVEMLAVMAIIALLAAVIVAGSAYAGRKADQKRARAGIERLKFALESYRAENGRYPTWNGAMDAGSWNTLTNLDRSLKFPDDMRDPWGNAFLYTNRSRFSYLIMSRGPKSGNSETFDDITNEQVGE